jgi:sialate O-acetylesterase
VSSCNDTICSSADPQSPLFCNSSVSGPNTHPNSLFNGMLYSLFNTTIQGVVWYQGSSNFANYGDFESNSGYACLFPKFIADLRRRWSVVSSTTSPDFPFLYGSLYGWCEPAGGANCNNNNKSQPNYPPTNIVAEGRWAQSADLGFVPNERMSNVYQAMGYDLEDMMLTPVCFSLFLYCVFTLNS